MSEQVDQTARNLRSVAEKLAGTVDENRAPARQAIEQLKSTGEELHKLAQQLAGGQGTLGKLLTDPAPFNKLTRLIDQLTRTLGGGHEPAFPTVESPANPQPRGRPPAHAGSVSPIGEGSQGEGGHAGSGLRE